MNNTGLEKTMGNVRNWPIWEFILVSILYHIVLSVFFFVIFFGCNSIAIFNQFATLSWPTTRGRILSTTPEREEILYQYAVDDIIYESERYDFYRIWENLEIELESLKAGKIVVVHYDPKNPNRSVLDTNDDLDWRLRFALMLLVAMSFPLRIYNYWETIRARRNSV